MIDTKLLEAWCHWIEVEKEADEDMKLMAADIRAVLKELKAAKEVLMLARAYKASHLLVDRNHFFDSLEEMVVSET